MCWFFLIFSFRNGHNGNRKIELKLLMRGTPVSPPLLEGLLQLQHFLVINLNGRVPN